METNGLDNLFKDFVKRLDHLEKRISNLEEQLSIKVLSYADDDIVNDDKMAPPVNSGQGLLESKIGEYGLAWLGNIVLFFGIVFLEQYIRRSGSHMVSAIFGYVSATSIYILGTYLKKSLPRMASLFKLNSYLILFYITLHLHFYNPDPLITSSFLAVVFLISVSVLIQIISIRERKAYLTGVSILFLSVSAIVCGFPLLMLSLSFIIALIGLYSFMKYSWIRILYLAIVLSYLINLIWLFNNPFIGNEFHAIESSTFEILFLFLIGITYSIPMIFNKGIMLSRSDTVGVILVNGMGFSTILLLHILNFYSADYTLLMLLISLFCMAYSIILQVNANWKIGASLYALYGFVTLSIAIYGVYNFPMAYFMLAIQSLLVVIMAIWFRSKFIVVMNSLLFLLLLIFYLQSSDMINGVNVSFSVAALATARILNWKKDRLTIKTDLLRNYYLITGSIMVMVSLYFLVPDRYIALSWTAAAVLYFILSLLLRNVKYRYLALGTLISAAFYLFIIDLARIELAYRVIALMVFAIISIGLSIYYSRRAKNKSSTTDE